MNVLRYTDAGYEDKLHEVARASSLFEPVIEERTRAIIEAVRARGDAALLDLTERFDGAKLRAEQLAVSQAEFFNAAVQASGELRKAIEFALRNIERFSRSSLPKAWSGRNSQGARVGERYDPLQRVGVYIPGGAAPLVSTTLMTIVLARVAGCQEIVVCTPCGKNGAINPALLLAARLAGATEVYRVGGAQAIAAMALGTPAIAPVHKVFGPGNAYVVAAKRLLFGYVAVDLLPGPSEVLILADQTANPAFAAADLLAQAEHGSGHERVWLASTSGKFLKQAQREIDRQLPALQRRELIRQVLDRNGWLIQVKNIEDGIRLANLLAPEHCEVVTAKARQVASRIVTAGAIFLGPWSPTVLGDYVAGPSHTLPTGGAGRSFAGLTVDQFLRRTSVVEYDRTSLRQSVKTVGCFASIEGLDAHGRSATIRLEPKTGRRACG